MSCEEEMGVLNRRFFLRTAALASAASIAGCSIPSVPAGVRIDSTASKAKELATKKLDWKGEWEDLVAAAKVEGRLSLLTLVGEGYGRVVDSFQQTFPEITVRRLAESSASVWLGMVTLGRRAGSYEYDLAFVQAERALAAGAPARIWSPLRPLLRSPDVVEDRLWRDGLNARFLDTGGTLCFAWECQLVHAYAINTDLARPGEIKTVKDLLAPRWRGRILSLDPRAGTGLLSAASVAKRWGADVVKQLLVDQKPTFLSSGPGGVTEPLADGEFAIALGVRPKALNPIRAQGRGYNVQYLDLPDADFVAGTPMLAFDRAPHPAAAKLFANWVLTSEVQTALAGGLQTNSARTDVAPFEPDGVATAGATYFDPGRDASFQHVAETQMLVRDLLRAGN